MLTTLKQIIQEVSQLPNAEQSLQRLVQSVKLAMEVDSCSFYLADHVNRVFVLTATDGLDKDAVGSVKIGFDEGLIGLVGDREEPLNIRNAHQHPRFKHYPEVKEESYRAFIGTPIIHKRKVLGVITLQQSEERKFDDNDEAFLVTIAAQIALYIANAEAQGQLLNFTESNDRETRVLNGVPGSPGLAIGRGFAADFHHEVRNVISARTQDPQYEITKYRRAVELTRTQVNELSSGLGDQLPEDVIAIFNLYQHLLDANSLGREVEAFIHQNWNAETSLKMVVEAYVARFENMDDPYMRERAVDIVDLSNRILTNIVGDEERQQTIEADKQYILVAKEISATMLAEFPGGQLAGVISILGSNNSHAAILAKAMGIPAVMGLEKVSVNLLKGQEIFIDGYSGIVSIHFDSGKRDEYIALIQQEVEFHSQITAQADEPPVTKDQVKFSLCVNAGLSADIELEQYRQGDGVGLYRTEIPFMLRQRFPSEEEQCSLYRQVLQAHPSKEMTMRTLDIGGDKPLSYFPIVEDNPFLGWRGIRLTLDHPDIFLIQLRAMMRASMGLSNLHILLPMISSIAEVDEAKRLIKQAFLEVKEEALEQNVVLSKPAVGVMLEVPSVLFLIPQLAQRVDFFSVGTNDLTQYLLAVDRNNPRVASIYSSFHPAVVNALCTIFEGATRYRVPVTVCGELAGDPLGALLLAAIGYRKLSMNAHSLHKISWVLRQISISDANGLMPNIATAESSDSIKRILEGYLESRGLGGLVRAGG